MKAQDIKTVVVIGGGTMGQGIAQSFAQAGRSVRVLARKRETLDKCRQQIDRNLRLFAEFQLSKETPEAVGSRIMYLPMTELSAAITGCHFVVETIPEVLADKKEVFAKLDGCDPNIILGSNTSSITITTLTEGMKTASRVVGTHYFNPAHIMPLVEIHRGKYTSDDAIQATRELMLEIGKKPILVKKEIPGFIVNRVQWAMGREILHLLDEGVVSPEDMDLAAKASYGLRLACIGNMEAFDMVGLDTALAVGNRIFGSLSNSTEPSRTLVEKVQRGELGVKSGQGFLDYAGKSREEILEDQNRRLLKQLRLFDEIG